MTPQKIITDIEKAFKIKDLTDSTRQRPYPQLRATFLLLAHEFFYSTSDTTTLEHLGRYVKLNRITVWYWLNKIENELEYEPEIKQFYEDYREDLKIKTQKQITGIVVKDVRLRREKAICF